jgi:hypothetical protein
MLSVASVFACCGLAAATARMASERGRSAIFWTVLSALIGLATMLVTVASLALARVVLGVGLWFVAPIASMSLTLALVWRLPERVPTITGARWLVRRLSSTAQPAADCELGVDNGVLRVGDVSIANGAITEIAADGECLRIGWDAGSVTLMPAGKERTAKQRAKRSQGLEKRLRELLG